MSESLSHPYGAFTISGPAVLDIDQCFSQLESHSYTRTGRLPSEAYKAFAVCLVTAEHFHIHNRYAEEDVLNQLKLARSKLDEINSTASECCVLSRGINICGKMMREMDADTNTAKILSDVVLTSLSKYPLYMRADGYRAAFHAIDANYAWLSPFHEELVTRAQEDVAKGMIWNVSPMPPLQSVSQP